MTTKKKAPLETVSLKSVRARRKKLAEIIKEQVIKEVYPIQTSADILPERDIRLIGAQIPVRNIRRSIVSLITYAEMMAFLLEQIKGDCETIKALQKQYLLNREAEKIRIAEEKKRLREEREAKKAAEQEINN